jgi:hypothetical protein
MDVLFKMQILNNCCDAVVHILVQLSDFLTVRRQVEYLGSLGEQILLNKQHLLAPQSASVEQRWGTRSSN